MNILIDGPQGSGKSTQAKVLAEVYNLNFIDSGSVLRASVGTPLGDKAREYMDKGLWVPEDLYFQILKQHVETKCDKSKGFVLTGIPRTMAQIPFLENELGIRLDKVFKLKVSPEVFWKRMEKRVGLESRSDDTTEAIESRLKEYEEKTGPVIDYYRSKGIVDEINGELSVEEVQAEIAKRLKEFGPG